MPTISGMFSVTGPVTIAVPPSARARTSATSAASTTSAQYADLNQVYRRVMDLNRALVEAEKAVDALGGGARRTGTGAAVSGSALGLDTTPLCSLLGSTEELNTVPTSFSPRGPSWNGGSTSPVTVGGTYTGSTDDTFRLQVRSSDAVVGGDLQIRIRVYVDGGATLRETLTWPAFTPAGTVRTTSDGLEISLGDGTALRNDWLELSVSASQDSEVDTAKPLNGTRNDDPGLQPGLAVAAGSFTVNGQEIVVAADDTVQGVLDRINASAAGVTAVYDADTELVSLERDDPGALEIALADDTSGFLAAVKLTGASPSLGSETGDLGQPMDRVAALAEVVAGSFTVNGEEIAVDPLVDSLADVLDRIGTLVPGISASFDTDTGKVTITAGSGGGSVDLEDGGTGLLAGLDLIEGTHAGRGRAGVSRLASRRVGAALEGVERALERLYAVEVTDSDAQQTLDGVLSRIGAAVTLGLAGEEDALEAAGLRLDVDASRSDRVMELVSGHFERGLRGAGGADLKAILAGSARERGDGLLGVLGAAGSVLEGTLREACGTLGIYLDRRA